MEGRGRLVERGNECKMSKSRGKSKLAKPRVEWWNCENKGHLRTIVGHKKKKQSNNKEKEVFVNIASNVAKDDLILAFDEKLESWVLNSSESFHATTNKECHK